MKGCRNGVGIVFNTKLTLSCATRVYGLKYYKIVKKWSENASREVQKSKVFLPRGRGPHPPQPWTFRPRRV